MKILFILLFSCATLVSTGLFAQIGQAPPPVSGHADVFTYDGSGNRIKREYIITIIAPKQNNEEEHAVDTLRQQFDNGPGNLKDKILVKAYPNPVADQMIVENLSWKDGYKATIKIYDIAGKQVQVKPVDKAKEYFWLSSYAPGVYQVHYYLDGALLTTWKIVKK